MVPNATDRERLASDLELLGLLADPSQGPLAHLLSPMPASPKDVTRLALVIAALHRGRAAAWAMVQRVKMVRPTEKQRFPTRAVPSR